MAENYVDIRLHLDLLDDWGDATRTFFVADATISGTISGPEWAELTAEWADYPALWDCTKTDIFEADYTQKRQPPSIITNLREIDNGTFD